MSKENSDKQHRMHSHSEENALWSIVGYLLSGLLIWGGIGWGLDRWLGTTYLVLIGMLLGAGASIYLVWLRFGRD
jgi:F0F1-type ATP synthase assembly protein I